MSQCSIFRSYLWASIFVPDQNDLSDTAFTERRIPQAELSNGWRIS
jgi:hypothetical protein